MVPWLIAEFRPGFSDDLTSWRTEIRRPGEPIQKVHICRSTPREESTLEHRCDVRHEQIQELERMVAVLDYAAIIKAFKRASEKICVTGAPQIDLIVNASAATRVTGDLLGWDLEPQRDTTFFSPAVADAIRLWQAIDRLSPHRLHS